MFNDIQVVRRLPRLRNVGARLGGVMVFGVLVSLSALIVVTGPDADPESRTEKQWPVSYREALPGSMVPGLQVYGKLEAEQIANLRAAASGTVSAVHYKEGDWVDRGDILISLDAAELQLDVRATEAALQQAQAHRATIAGNFQLHTELTVHHQAQATLSAAKLDRFITLHNQRMIADAQLDEARQEANERAMTLATHRATLRDFPHQLAYADAAVAEAATRLERAQLDLSHATLSAPFSGRVLSIDIAQGDRVTTGASMLRFADYGSLRIRAAIPPHVAQRLRQSLTGGDHVIASTGQSGQQYNFELAGLSGDIKSGQGGIDAFFTVAPDVSWALGSVLPLHLHLPAEHDVIAVPMHALYDNNRIYRINNNRLQALAVERVGEYLDDHGNYQLLVRSAQLTRGDLIMVSQLPVAMTGMLVSPVAAGTPEQTPPAVTELAGQWSSP